MAMKLWYQNMSNTDLRPEYRKTLTEYVNSIADPGTVIDCYGTPAAMKGIQYPSIRYLDVGGILARAITAERSGYDAFIIGNILDAGIHEVRELIGIPVIGHLQSSLLLMSMMAKNFSIIADHAKLAGCWENLIAGYGFRDRLVSVASLGVELTKNESLYTDKSYGDARVAEIMEHGRRAVAAGAEMLLILPGSVYLRLAKEGIKEIDGAPIFNSIPGVIKMAELMVKYRQITGLYISRKHTYASPSKEVIDEMIARHNLRV
jgi:allantoin racemase